MREHIEEEINEYFPPPPKSMKKEMKQAAAEMQATTGLVAEGLETVEEEEEVLCDFDYIMRDPLLFGDYRNAVNEGEPRFYEDLLDYDAIYFLFQEILEEYNERKGKLSLVLFEDALEHLTRIHRTLRMDRGHMMIIGVGGSGKQSLSRLAAFAAGCEIFEILLSRGYNENSFKEDIKKLYSILGVENKKTMFLFTAASIAEEGFLEFINNILTIGIIPSLFNDEDKDAITGQCRKQASDAGYGITKFVCLQF